MKFPKSILFIILVLVFCYGAFRANFFNNVRILKKAGFFQTFEQKSTYALGMYFLKEHKRMLRQFSYISNPHLRGIMMKDKSKAVEIYGEIIDTEDNKFYAKMVKNFGLVSGGQFNPTNIKEEWATKEGPIVLTYDIDGQEVKMHPQLSKGSWLDYKISNYLLKELEDRGIILKTAPQLGSVNLRLRKEEEQLLKDKFGWEFTIKNRD